MLHCGFRKYVSGIILKQPEHLVWMAPACYAVLFGAVGALLALPLLRWPRALNVATVLFLLLVAGSYLLAARWPRRYEGVVWVAIGGRFLGFLYLGGVWLGGAETAFVVLAGGDLFFSVLHLSLLLPARRD